MFDILQSPEFWFGAAVLGAYQVSKFSELNSFDPVFGRLSHIPNLRAWDFAGAKTFAWSLVIFLAVTFLLYLAACLISPPIIAGWVQVTQGPKSGQEIAEYVQGVPYPLYICALFVGVAHQTIPGFSKVVNVQRNLFHYWLGVPRMALDMADNATTEIFARAKDRQSLASELKTLVSDAFQARIKSFADANFYRMEIERLKLDSEAELADAMDGSTRELKTTIQQLLVGAAIAAVRSTGSKGLSKLETELGVPPHPKQSIVYAFLVSLLWCVFGVTVLWFAIPMLTPLMRLLLPIVEFWPTDMSSSAVYVAAQVIPILLSTLLIVILIPESFARDDASSPVLKVASRYSGFLCVILLLVVCYDFLQSFSDYGINRESFDGTLGSFLLEWLPYHVLHGFISVAVSLLIIRHFGSTTDEPLVRQLVTLAVVAGTVSGFYAVARTMFQYQTTAVDFVVLVILLNIVGAFIAFAAIHLALARQPSPKT